MTNTTTQKFIVLDTEAAPLPGHEKGVQAQHMRVYDLGYIVTDDTGIEYERRSLVINEAFDNRGLMLSAYYCDKLPEYFKGLKRGKKWQRSSMRDAMRLFADDVKTYNVREVWAYNALFDYTVLNASVLEYSNNYRGYFLPFGLKMYDILSMAKKGLAKNDEYAAWCNKHGLVTSSGRPRVTAEAVYNYLNGDNFKEEHTALADCDLELNILRECKRLGFEKPKPIN